MNIIKLKTVTVASLFCFTLLGNNFIASAGEADVLQVKAKCNKEAVCKFTVRVRHNDKGWQHYVNRWEILSLDGEVLATRVLAHPHVKEQPFSRSLKASIPEEHKVVIVRAHDSVHGYGGEEIKVILRE